MNIKNLINKVIALTNGTTFPAAAPSVALKVDVSRLHHPVKTPQGEVALTEPIARLINLPGPVPGTLLIVPESVRLMAPERCDLVSPSDPTEVIINCETTLICPTLDRNGIAYVKSGYARLGSLGGRAGTGSSKRRPREFYREIGRKGGLKKGKADE